MTRFLPLFVSLLLCGCAGAGEIAVFYALDPDLKTLKEASTDKSRTVKVGSRSIDQIRIGPHSVYAIKMGSGPVESALSAQALLSRFKCMMALSVGPVGSLREDLKVGTWVSVAKVVAYQKGTQTEAGFMLAAKSNFETAPFGASPLPPLLHELRRVQVASGEIFVASDHTRTQLHVDTGSDVVDMNLFGIAAACSDHRLPLYSWRIVSDRADASASTDFAAFCKKYEGAAGAALASLVKGIPASDKEVDSYPHLQQLIGQ
jgi:adenosylhomocysteine nucleosidase